MASQAPKKAAAPKTPKSVKTPETVQPIAAPVIEAEAIVVEAVPAEATIADAVQVETTLTEGTTTMTDTITTAANETAEKATAVMKDVQEKAKTVFAKSGEFAKDIVEFHKGNIEAVVASGKIAAEGAQTAGRDAVELGRKNWETSIAHLKSMKGISSPSEFLKMQGEFARAQFDAVVADFGKGTEFATKLGGEIVAPLQNRYAVVVEDVKARLAA